MEENLEKVWFEIENLRIQGKTNEAINRLNNNIKNKPDSFYDYFLLALCFIDKKDYPTAELNLKKTIMCNPRYHYSYLNIGNLFQLRENHNDAIIAYKRYLDFVPDDYEIYNNVAVSYEALDQYENAVLNYQKAIEKNPDNKDSYYNLALLLLKKKEFNKAKIYLNKTIEFFPYDHELYNNLGICFLSEFNFIQAKENFQKALDIEPDNAQYYSNLGIVNEALHKYDEAIFYYKTAIQKSEDNPVFYYNMSDNINLIEIENKIEQQKNNISFADYAEHRLNLGFLQLLKGDFKNGFKNYEWRFPAEKKEINNSEKCLVSVNSKLSISEIKGKKVFVRREQGLGDMFQFSRYLKKLKDNDVYVIFECSENNIEVFKTLYGYDEIISNESNIIPEFDYYIPIMSLPYFFETEIETIPSENPYLFSTDKLKSKWESFFSEYTEPRIGIVWEGSHTNKGNLTRSCPVNKFYDLAKRTGINFFSLQKNPSLFKLDKSSEIIKDLSEEILTFEDTANIIEQLDLVITIDSSVAHLAGAMGKKTFLILSARPDWRWMLNKNFTPWYPSIKIFRQKYIFDWDSVFDELYNDLIGMYS